ncbi:MAG: DUF2849 domain-containing protein [Hyphomicrobiales bacterium]|nr:DUF2849 domain-containing protein [Hyphomicrobiales bacterium]
MAKKLSGPQIITANRLHDGLVVFLTRDGAWTRTPERAQIAREADQVSALQDEAAMAARANLIVDPYLIEVTHDGNEPVPVAHRERMRISGPSVSTSLGQPAYDTAVAYPQPSSSAVGVHVQI